MAGLRHPTVRPEDASRIVQHGQISALFQPIESLQTGECRGFEALARLPYRGRSLSPDAFLAQLGPDDRLCLFGTMLGHAIAFLKVQQAARRDFYVSLNVEISLITSEDFVDVLQYHLDRYDFSGERLVLEILENEDVPDLSRLHTRLDAIHALGLALALDDIGSGYASLQKVKQLPIDIVKLDRSFSRNLETKPEDLVFVMSVQLLAQGLGKRMIVEGIESLEVYDALRMLGVIYGQGFAIAAPMPASAVDSWLAGRVPREPDRVPKCLLGAYASHLTVVESCRSLKRQPLPMAWTAAATDYCGCAVGQLFGLRDWHATEFGRAHQLFHAALPSFDRDEAGYEAAVDRFQISMKRAMLLQAASFRCDPVDGTLVSSTSVRPIASARKPRRAVA